jgi:HAE1 family hydrophobic/amphiphilic exporter-1
MVVDNAIVIVDNVYRHFERGKRPQEAAIFGSSEIFLAITASTMTTVVVFLPMLFIPGVVGVIFGELAVIVIVTLLASLFTAATFSPMLCSKWLHFNNDTAKAKPKLFVKFYDFSEKMFQAWESFYAKQLGWSLRHKKTIIIGFSLAFIFSLALTRFVGNEFIPEEDTGDMRINISLAVGTRLEETDKVAQQVEDLLSRDIPEADYYYIRTGSVRGLGRAFGGVQGSHTIAAGAKLVVKTQRKRSVTEVAQSIRNKIKNIPGVIKADISTGNPIGRMITGGGGKAIQLEIIGHSFEETDALAEKIKKILENIPGAVDVDISREFNRPELKIEVDREKSAALGLDMNTIANTLKAFIQGTTATKYREKGETYDIYLRLEEASRTKIEDIESLSIVAPLPEEKTSFLALADAEALKGVSRKHIKLSNIAKIYETIGPQDIDRKNRERVVQVECNAYRRSTGKIVEDLERELGKLILPGDIMINIGGEAEEQRKAFKDLTLLLLLGICLVYMVMAAQFESLLDPFIIMFAIPFTFIGVILGFVLTNTTLSIVSYLGIIMLMGIVVNNAIVLVSYIQILRARGLSMYEAVTQGGKDRLRPILMTTITTLAGLLPLAISRGEGSEVWQPLGITMIGGLTVSTLITLLFVPTLYAIFHRKAALAEGKK